MYRIGLNKAKTDNYSFFCPDAPMHLNICQPVANTNRLTSSILRGIKGGTLIDFDNIMATLEPKEEVKVVEVKVLDKGKEIENLTYELEKKEEVKEVKKPKRKSKKKGDE